MINNVPRAKSAPIITCLRFNRSAQTPPAKTKVVPLNILAASTNPRVVALPPESMMTIANAIGKAPVPKVINVEERKILRKSLYEKSPPVSKSFPNLDNLFNSQLRDENQTVGFALREVST